VKLSPSELNILLKVIDDRIEKARHDQETLVRRGKLLAGREPKAGFIGVLEGIRGKLMESDGDIAPLSAPEIEQVGAEGMKNGTLKVLRGALTRAEPGEVSRVDRVLHEGDHVQLFPPVAGGGGEHPLPAALLPV